MRYSPPTPFIEDVTLDAFDCGNEDLNVWLKHKARKSESMTARTYVVCEGDNVVGYYCLAAGEVSRAGMPTAKLRKNAPRDIPVVVIGRLAVDRRHQGAGLGGAMLRDALQRAIGAARAIGVRVVLVHAIDDGAARYYRERGFVPLPADPRTLILPIETAIAAIS